MYNLCLEPTNQWTETAFPEKNLNVVLSKSKALLKKVKCNVKYAPILHVSVTAEKH